MAFRQAAWLPEAGIMQRSVTRWLAGVAGLLSARLYIDLWLTPQYTRNKVGTTSATLEAFLRAVWYVVETLDSGYVRHVDDLPYSYVYCTTITS